MPRQDPEHGQHLHIFAQAAIRGRIAIAAWARERAAARLKVFVRGTLQRCKV